ncbi:MAG: TolC family outer membrane protein [Hyphomonadaceae bacterium]
MRQSRQAFGRLTLWTSAFALLSQAAHADTLADALSAAYRNNPTLAAARLNAHAADQGIAQARAGYLPQVDLTASAGVRRNDVTPPGGPTTRTETDPQSVGVDLVQPLYTGGFLTSQSRAARADANRARANLRGVEQNVLLAVIAAYEDVRRDAEIVRIRQNNVDVLARQLAAANDRFEVGEITRTDVAQAEARVAGGQAGLAGAQAAYEASRANYAALVGAAPQDLQAPPPHPPLPASLEEALSAARDANPEIAAAEEAQRAARARVGLERSALLPQIAVIGRWESEVDAGGPDVDSEGASAVAQFSMPLFEGGYGRARIRQSRFAAAAAEASTEEIRRAVIADVVAAWNDVAASRRVVESAREQARANEFALEGVEVEQQVGLRTTLDVLNAQQEFLDAQLAVVSAERDAYVAAHALLAAIGALNGAAIAVNAPLYDPDQPVRDMRGMLPWQDQGESP